MPSGSTGTVLQATIRGGGDGGGRGGPLGEGSRRGSRHQVDVLAFSRRKNASSGVEAKEMKRNMNGDQCMGVGTPGLSFSVKRQDHLLGGIEWRVMLSRGWFRLAIEEDRKGC